MPKNDLPDQLKKMQKSLKDGRVKLDENKRKLEALELDIQSHKEKFAKEKTSARKSP